MYKFVLLLCFLSAAVIAYDFKDTEYNEYLMQDLIDISDDAGDFNQAFRFKRDTTTATTSDKDEDKKCKQSNKKHHGYYKCCNDDADTESLHEQFKDMKKQCLSEIRGNKKEEETSFDMFSCEKVNKTKEEYVCVTECVGKKIHILDNEGNLIDEAVRKHVKSDLSVTEWQKAAADDVSTKCLSEVREALKDKKDTGDKCNCAALKFGHCIWREFTKSCPKEMQSDSKKCTGLREKLEKGEKIDFHTYHHKYHHSRAESSEEKK